MKNLILLFIALIALASCQKDPSTALDLESLDCNTFYINMINNTDSIVYVNINTVDNAFNEVHVFQPKEEKVITSISSSTIFITGRINGDVVYTVAYNYSDLCFLYEGVIEE